LFTDVERTPPADRTLNSMPTKSLTGTALRQGEAGEFAAVLFEPRPQTVAIALYVGRPETWKRHGDALAAIRELLAPAGNRQSR
jgi:hypothetical protein